VINPSGSHEARVAETRPDQCRFVRRKPCFRKSRPKSTRKWLKVSKRIPGLYQCRATGVYHARVRYGGKLYRESLKNWKFSSNDANERDFWDDYMEAYEEMIQETATKEAPWYVVPADNKWFTRVVVAAAVMETLADLDLEYPEVGENKLAELATAKKKLLSK
jgi:hypothetical protein